MQEAGGISATERSCGFSEFFSAPGAEAQRRPDAIVAHAYDIYDNGTLSTVQYGDTSGDHWTDPDRYSYPGSRAAGADAEFEHNAAPEIQAEMAKAKPK
jgi:hypothetical protein